MDSPRSWAVAVACCWINVFTFAMVRSAAVVYTSVLSTFHTSREEASWPVNLSAVCYFLTGPVAGLLATYVAIWKLTLTGCILGSLAVCACYFAVDVTYLNVFLGVIHGTSIGLLALCSVVINQHFLKFRAMASGISNAGFTIGGLIFPPLVQELFDRFGVRGMFLLCGALMLNSTAGAFLQRSPPLPILQTVKVKSETLRNHQETEKILQPCPPEAKLSSPDVQEQSQNGEPGVKEETVIAQKVSRNISCTNDPECKLVPADQDDEDMSCRVLVQSELVSSKKELKIQAVSIRNSQSLSLKSKRRHLLSFLILPRFYLIAFSLSQILNNMTTFMTVIVDFALDRDVSKWHAVLLVSYYTVMDLVARLGSGWITDKGYLKRSTMMAVHLTMWAVSLYLMPVCRPYYCQALLSMVCGWCNGSTLILIAVFFVELVGIEKLGVCFGIATFLAGLLGLLRPTLIGYYRDSHGDYEGLFTLLGGLTLAMAILWYWVLTRERCEVLKKAKRSKSKPLPQADITASDDKEQRL
uniref:Putative monocarboxylate transporter n=2 Tax=Ixodes TaxID=6944 RepID=A0A4D5RP51_IXOSC